VANLLAQYSSREKFIVALALLVVLALACHSIIIEPYQQRLVELQESIDQHNADLKWMRSVVPGLPVAGAEISAGNIDGTLANFIDQAVRSQGLSNQLSQMSPVGNDEIRMRYSAVDFNRLVSFVARIHASGLDVKDIRITAGDTPGIVDSSLVLVRQ
jgi:type II secretory pathway component PulM